MLLVTHQHERVLGHVLTDFLGKSTGEGASFGVEDHSRPHRRAADEGDYRAELLSVEDVLDGLECVAHQVSM